jgi:lysozyme family protein
MKKTTSEIIDEILLIEGGYVNNPNDRGGPTKFGITEKVAKENGYYGPMEMLPKMTAKLIYYQVYWINSGIKKINEYDQKIAVKLFDAGVNVGVTRVSKWLQRLLNIFIKADLSVDGKIGPVTLAALNIYLYTRKNHEGSKTLVKAINTMQGMHYINLAEQDPKQKTFAFGWFRNRIW